MRSHNNSTGSKEGAEVEEKGTAVDNDSSSSIISKQAAIPSDHGLSIAAVQTQTCDVDLVVSSSNVNNEDGIIFDVGASKKSTAHMQNGSKNGAYHSKRNVIQTSEASNANSMTAIVPSMPRCTERPGAGRGIKRNGTVASATIKSGGRGRKKRRGRPPNNARKPKPAKEVVADAKVQGKRGKGISYLLATMFRVRTNLYICIILEYLHSFNMVNLLYRNIFCSRK